ncbi:ATP-binding cassette domain-containing protein [Streptomyces mirabilis]|uniref:ATP-binding cassette domain-containing protein n=1 Tax=Streptomyces mirabilis TaxID=68239 RepID=UPI0036B30784
MSQGVLATGLVKRYGGTTAVAGLDLAVPEGTVLGLLGPNGAGKTTTVRMLSTLQAPDAGECTIAGVDIVRHPQKARKLLGLSGQYAAVDEFLTGYENLEMVGRLHRLGKTRARARARELLERFDLAEAGRRPARTYSGGMRRRLDLAGALVAAPPVVFLDEPTAGLDPSSRIGMWELVREMVDGGTTVVLTTQYLEEADQLASNIVVIDNGRIVAEGSPTELKRAVGEESLHVTLANREETSLVARALRGIGIGAPVVDEERHTIAVPVSGGTDALTAGVRALDTAGVRPVDIGLRRPTLDDVFLQLTGAGTGTGTGPSRPGRTGRRGTA